jgi:hypothetical protein
MIFAGEQVLRLVTIRWFPAFSIWYLTTRWQVVTGLRVCNIFPDIL